MIGNGGMKRKILLLVLSFIYLPGLSAQQKAWVFFDTKDSTSYRVSEYLSQKAIARRLKHNVPLSSFEDWPVKTEYKNQISRLVDSVIGESRWLNGLIVEIDRNSIPEVLKLPFVAGIMNISSALHITKQKTGIDPDIDYSDSLLMKMQTNRMQGNLFRERNLNGRGVRIAVFDVGFKGMDTHPAFKALFDGKKILKTWDFIKQREDVFRSGRHGTMVMSCLAGHYGNINLGLADGAEYLLARTERVMTEFKSEEYNWVLAAEWAERNGADIISCSLGYSDSRYFQEEMDGKHSVVAKAAEIAFSKGILIVNAVGNEGTNRWQTIITPADAPHVLAVGATDPFTDVALDFSSPGPSSDHRLKPNVSAYGEVIAAFSNGYSTIQGSSFSAPLVAGFAACILQMNPALTNTQLFEIIEKSGHLYPYYDYLHGYGIPQASRILESDIPVQPTFDFQVKDTLVIVHWIDSGDVVENKNFYYHIADSTGFVKYYSVIRTDTAKALKLKRPKLNQGDRLNMYFERFTKTYHEKD
jgi:serine protease AprX